MKIVHAYHYDLSHGVFISRACHPVQSSRGYSLVELIVVIVIVGVLAVASAPLFFSVNKYQQRGFYDQTVAAVRYAQKYAIASGCTVRVQLLSNGYNLFRAANAVPVNPAVCSGGVYNDLLTHPATGQNFTNNAPSGVTLSPATDFTFAPNGSTSIAVPEITVGGRKFTIDAGTGFVQK